MKLTEHLYIGTPLIWVNTDEPERMTDYITASSNRSVYRVDPFDGFVVWSRKKDKWVKVLVEIEGEPTTTFDFEVAISHVYQEHGVFVITNAHLVAEKLLAFLSGVYGGYRTTFDVNDKENLPMQVVMMSFNSDIPPEIARHTALVSAPLPGAEEIAEIFAHIKVETPDKEVFPENADLTPLIRSAMGLTEAEITQACMLNLREGGVLNAEYVNEFKQTKIREGGMLEVRRPKLSFADVGGLDLAKKIIENAVWTWQNPQEAAEYDIVPTRRILMVGVPGSGKSLICEATARSLGLDLAIMGVARAMDKFIGESERKMRAMFAQIHAMAPIVAWMDELGRDLSGSGVVNDGGTTDRVHGEFLTGLQDLPDNIFLMAAANRIDGLPPEMLRADRFDKIMFVGYPSLEERVDIWRIHLGDKAVNHDLNLLAGATPQFTGAEIKSLLADVRNKISGAERRHITTEDIVGATPFFRNRLWLKHRGAIMDMYRRAKEEWEWASSGQLADADEILTGGVPMAGPKNTVVSKFEF